MANYKITDLTNYTTPDPVNDVVEIVDLANNQNKKVTRNNYLGIAGAPVGTTDSQTLTNKTLTSPTINGATLSGTLSGTYTLGGTPTFPATVVNTTGVQTLTNKTLTSPTINSPTITNASITADAITGFTTANSGTIYGVAITTGKLAGTSITNSTVGASQLNTGGIAATVLTSETTTSTSYVDLATVTDTVTVSIGVNGLALVNIGAFLLNSGASGVSIIGFAISGATTLAASDTYCLQFQAYTTGAQSQLSGSYLMTGLAAGSTTFKMKYRVTSGTGTFSTRRISVVPL